MGKYVTLSVLAAALAFAAFSYFGRNAQSALSSKTSSAASPGKPGAGGKPNGFMGHFGYLITYPGSYDSYAEMQGRVEMAFFYPKGGQPSVDESKYKDLGLVRLEVFETPPGKQGAEVIAAIKRGVEKSLDERKEVYTVKDLQLLNGAFLVYITKPNEIMQLFVQGEKETYMFTGGEEAMMLSLAGSIRETGLAAPGK